MNRGIVLVGGGARGAYQAGVLKGIAQIASRVVDPRRRKTLFNIICGSSAGAINGAYLASRADYCFEAIEELCELWGNLSFEKVIDVRTMHLSRMAMRWTRELLLEGHLQSNFMLDAAPLSRLLKDEIDFDEIREQIERGILKGLAISATNYHTGLSITFFEADRDVKNWERSGRAGVGARLNLNHLLASGSLPLLFAPIRIGNCQFGDGGLRQNAPLSPAIHLGADRVLAISVQAKQAALSEDIRPRGVAPTVSLAGIVGLILNTAFYEGVDFDSERMLRINRTVDYLAGLQAEGRRPHSNQPGLAIRKIPLLSIRPSIDPAKLAQKHFQFFPRILRFFMRSLGASEENGADLMSYLAFESTYTRELLEMGWRDAHAKADEIRAFFEEAPLVYPSQVGMLKRSESTQSL